MAVLFATSSASGLDIRVAPQTLVMSSGGGQLTVHTDVPFIDGDGNGEMDYPVTLHVNGMELACNTFSDNVGNLVAQCSKETAKGAVGDFEGKTTTAVVALTVEAPFGGSASEEITVKK